MVVHVSDIDWGECSNDGCSQPTPWDMAAIIIFNKPFCSPACAKAGVEDMPDEPREVTLHDPQYSVDREPLGLDSDCVDIHRKGSERPVEQIEACAELYGSEFRVIDLN